MTSDTSPRPVSPLRARMIEDMTVRGFKEDTRRDYVQKVRTFAAFIGRSPDTARGCRHYPQPDGPPLLVAAGASKHRQQPIAAHSALHRATVPDTFPTRYVTRGFRAGQWG